MFHAFRWIFGGLPHGARLDRSICLDVLCPSETGPHSGAEDRLKCPLDAPNPWPVRTKAPPKKRASLHNNDDGRVCTSSKRSERRLADKGYPSIDDCRAAGTLGRGDGRAEGENRSSGSLVSDVRIRRVRLAEGPVFRLLQLLPSPRPEWKGSAVVRRRWTPCPQGVFELGSLYLTCKTLPSSVTMRAKPASSASMRALIPKRRPGGSCGASRRTCSSSPRFQTIFSPRMWSRFGKDEGTSRQMDGRPRPMGGRAAEDPAKKRETSDSAT